MTIIEYAATTVRALMAAEIAMAAVNCGAANVTRAQAEKLLGDYFARVEEAVPSTENNPLDCRSWSEPHNGRSSFFVGHQRNAWKYLPWQPD